MSQMKEGDWKKNLKLENHLTSVVRGNEVGENAEVSALRVACMYMYQLGLKIAHDYKRS